MERFVNPMSNNLSPEERLLQRGFTLPAAPSPRGHYAPYCDLPMASLVPNATGQLVFVSGQTCRVDGQAIRGISETLDTLEDARHAARVAMLNSLAALRAACGGALPPLCQVVRLRGFIRSGTDFTGHTVVLDAASELLHIAFPQQPLPSRTAVGVCSLPDQAWIEIELDVLIP